MAGVYSELRGFVLAHRGCAGPRHADVDPLRPNGYRLLVKCGCGVEFKRWVAPEDAEEDLLRSALLTFETWRSKVRPLGPRMVPFPDARAASPVRGADGQHGGAAGLRS